MKNRFYVQKIINNIAVIEGEELLHLQKVLRLKQGDCVEIFDENGNLYSGTIQKLTKSIAEVKTDKLIKNCANPKAEVVVFQALVKGDKLELITQKLSELGVFKIIPFQSTYCVAKENLNKAERLNKIALMACKQCGRTLPLKVAKPITFNKMINEIKCFDTVLFANETENIKQPLSPKGKTAIIVGSEGGFSAEEIKMIKAAGAKSISLGNRILRTETASITMSAIVLYLLGEL